MQPIEWRRPRRRQREVNIVPLVDVLMVLIFFFIMTMQFREERALNLQLPEIETAGSNVAVGMLRIALDEAGQVYLNEQEVGIAGLRGALETLAAAGQRERSILLSAHEEAPLRIITAIMDSCRQAGLENIRLQSRPGATEAEADEN